MSYNYNKPYNRNYNYNYNKPCNRNYNSSYDSSYNSSYNRNYNYNNERIIGKTVVTYTKYLDKNGNKKCVQMVKKDTKNN